MYPSFSRKMNLGKLPIAFYDLDDTDAEEVYDIVSGIIGGQLINIYIFIKYSFDIKKIPHDIW